MNEDVIRRLERQAAYYCHFPVHVKIDYNSDVNHSYFRDGAGYIILSPSSVDNDSLTASEKTMIYRGINAHEIGHLIFSDFSVVRKNHESLAQNEDNLMQVIKEYRNDNACRKKALDALVSYMEARIKPDILNVLEDGAVENTIGQSYPELYPSVMYTRRYFSKRMMEGLSDEQGKTNIISRIIDEIAILSTYSYNRNMDSFLADAESIEKEDIDNIRKTVIYARILSRNTGERDRYAEDIIRLIVPMIRKEARKHLYKIRISTDPERELEKIFGSYPEIPEIYDDNPDRMETNPHADSECTQISDTELAEYEKKLSDRTEAAYIRTLSEISRIEKNNNKLCSSHLKAKIRQEIRNRKANERISRKDADNTPSVTGRKILKDKEKLIIESNQMAKRLKREIMHMERNHTRKGLDSGRYIASDRLYRYKNDGKVFMERKKGNKPDIVISILVDSSSSMQQGDRLSDAIRACYRIARVMQILKIRFSINAHKTIRGATDYISVVSFRDSAGKETTDRIFSLDANGGTDEYSAISQTLHDLASYKKSSQKGVVFVITDAETDEKESIRELCRAYKEMYNIEVIGLGVGTRNEIADTYENAIYIPDSQNLSDQIITEFRRLVI